MKKPTIKTFLKRKKQIQQLQKFSASLVGIKLSLGRRIICAEVSISAKRNPRIVISPTPAFDRYGKVDPDWWGDLPKGRQKVEVLRLEPVSPDSQAGSPFRSICLTGFRIKEEGRPQPGASMQRGWSGAEPGEAWGSQVKQRPLSPPGIGLSEVWASEEEGWS